MDEADAAPASLRAEADGTTSEFLTTALATQDVEAVDRGFRISGRLEFEVASVTGPSGETGAVGAGAQVEGVVRFAVTVPTDYLFTRTEVTELATGNRAGDVFLRLQSEARQVFLINDAEAYQGRLEPGEYQFEYMRDVTNSVAGGIEEGKFRGTYDISLALTPIPLPPAAWPGLLTLAGVGAACWARRRKKC